MAYTFFNHDKAYLYEYMNNWRKFNETSLPEIEDFYSHLNMKDITDKDYAHAQRAYKDLKEHVINGRKRY